ncbi:hypothetical protein ACFZB9_23045 [Kitasatospora sp. NPDC008050]|uniref:hypothetical protein n=1 Tax=Kitasatospora sp. NPDC008050 TaxID=3364021 RepID=UPI0036E936BF
MTENDTVARLPHVPVPRAPQIRRAIDSLGGLIKLDMRVQGRRAADIPVEDLAGLLAGIVNLTAFGIDLERQPQEKLQSPR